MKRLARYLIPLLSLFAIVGMLRVLEAATTLTGQVTIPSPTMVQPGPIISGQALRIGEAISNTFDPRVSGFTRPTGSFLYTRDGTTAYEKTGTTSRSWEVIAAGSTTGGVGRTGAINARALSLVGFTASTFTCQHDDLDYAPAAALYFLFNIASGTETSTLNNVVGGMADISTGATANSTAILTSPALIFGRPDTNKFYFASRAAVITAVDAATNATVLIGSVTINPNIGIGVCGATSTATFQAWYDGASTTCGGTKQSTGVSVDAAQHIWEVWGLGDGKLHFAIDLTEISGSPFTMGASPVVSQRAGWIATNGATAAARTIEVDWLHYCWSET